MSRSEIIPKQTLGENYNSVLVRPVLKNITRKTRDDKAHRHLFHEIIYIRKGEGTHFIDDQEIKLNAHSFYLININQVHGFHYGKNLEGTLIRFNDDFLPTGEGNPYVFRDYTNLLLLSNTLSLKPDESKHFEDLLKLLLDEYRSDSTRKFKSLQYLLLALLNKLTEKLLEKLKREGEAFENRDRKLYHSFHLMSNSFFNSEHQLDFYAAKLGISPRKLSNICTQYSGKTAKAILIDKIISEVKRYLKYSSLSIKEIAYRLGYEDPAYLSRIFKNYVKQTMSNYRRNETGRN